MTISRDDIDQGKVDFSDTATQSRLPPVHPGEVLQDRFMRAGRPAHHSIGRSPGGVLERVPSLHLSQVSGSAHDGARASSPASSLHC